MITALNNTVDNIYVKNVTLNDKPLNMQYPFIGHSGFYIFFAYIYSCTITIICCSLSHQFFLLIIIYRDYKWSYHHIFNVK